MVFLRAGEIGNHWHPASPSISVPLRRNGSIVGRTKRLYSHPYKTFLYPTAIDEAMPARIVDDTLLVAVGVYLLSPSLRVDPTPAGTEAARGLAAVAFLAGSFVEHALWGLGVVSERLNPGNPKNVFGSY